MHLSNNNVKVGLQPTAIHSDRFFDFCLSINFIFLWQHMDNFLSRKHYQFVHLLDKLIDIVLINDLLRVCSRDIVTVLKTTNVLTCNTYHHILNILSRGQFGFLNGLLNRLNRLSDIVDHPTMNS